MREITEILSKENLKIHYKKVFKNGIKQFLTLINYYPVKRLKQLIFILDKKLWKLRHDYQILSHSIFYHLRCIDDAMKQKLLSLVLTIQLIFHKEKRT